MVFRKRILSITVASALGALSAFAASPQAPAQKASTTAAKDKAQPKATKDHVLHGSVITVSDDVLTVRSGKKDVVFKLDSSIQKPTAMAPGTEIAITYRDVGKDHVASSIELSSLKGLAAKPPSHK